MEASQQFENILEAVMGSQLNFQLQLSPFSATICLKKSLAKDRLGNTVRQNMRLTSSHAHAHDDVNKLEKEIENLQAQNEKLTAEASNHEVTIAGLELKISKAETAAVKVFEDKKVEVEAYKKQVKFLNSESDQFKKEIHRLQKLFKEKDKELVKAENKCENFECCVKRLKTEVSSLKSNAKRLSKEKSIKSSPTCPASTQTCPSLLDLVPTSCSSAAPVSPISRPLGPSLASALVISSPVAWSSPPTSPSRQPPPLASIHSPCTPTGRPTKSTPQPQSLSIDDDVVENNNYVEEVEISTYEQENVNENDILKEKNVENNNYEEKVENSTYKQENENKEDTLEEKNVKQKCILLLEVQEILKEEKVDFKKLIEAVRNDKMDFCVPEDEKDYNSEY